MATFSSLPDALRAQIWEMTVEPRTVHVRMRYENPRHRRVAYLISTTPVPAVLQVCREARNRGLYQRVFSEIASPRHGSQYVWANLDRDIIDIGTSLLEFFAPVASEIRKLKMEREMSATSGGEFFYHSEKEELHKFVNTEEIHVVCADGLFAWLGALEEIYWPCGNDNVFLIDPDDDQQVFRGEEGLSRIEEMQNQWLEDRGLL